MQTPIWNGLVSVVRIDGDVSEPRYQVKIRGAWQELSYDEVRGLLHALWADLDEQRALG